MLLVVAALCGCAALRETKPPAETVRDDHLVILTVKADDTLENLAQEYLGDRRKAHWIAEYNQVRSVRPGMRVVIPLKPVYPGGVRAEGYQTVPVAVYPEIARENATPGQWSAASFEAHLRFLRRGGFVSIGLDRLAAFFSLHDQLPPRAVLLTFDSAERWVYEIAYPLLKRQGFTAALFVPTALVGKPGCMGWQELAEMAADGFDIAAAGLSGRRLTGKPGGVEIESYLKELEDQVVQPRKALAEHLKRDCRYFAYPEGETDELVTALLKKHGYRAAFTRQGGSNPFFVDRFRIRRSVLNPQDENQWRDTLTTFVPAELR